MELPSRITATRSFTYDTAEVRASYKDVHGETLTDEEIMDLIDEWITEDMRSPLSRHDVVVVNADTGEELS